MPYGWRGPYNTIDINIHGNRLVIQSSKIVEKYLGVYIVKNLKWSIHIKLTVNKLRMILYNFKVLTKYLPIIELTKLYYALVESHLRYANVAWGNAFRVHRSPLEILQKWFLRLIFQRLYRYNSDSLYREAQILDKRHLFYLRVNYRYHIGSTIIWNKKSEYQCMPDYFKKTYFIYSP